MIDLSTATQQLKQHVLATANPNAIDHKAWAKRLQARHQAGEKLNSNQVRCYRNALGLNVPAQ